MIVKIDVGGIINDDPNDGKETGGENISLCKMVYSSSITHFFRTVL